MDKPPLHFPEGPWRNLLEKAYSLIDAISSDGITVPRWSLGLWVSRAYYKTPEEATTVAATLRARKIPCDVLTLDGRAAWDVSTRFDFEWDVTRFPDPYEALAKIKVTATECRSLYGPSRRSSMSARTAT